MIFEGDCKLSLSFLSADSIDAFVTDPPYGLSKEPDIEVVLKNWLNNKTYKHGSSGFMGKSWDSFVPNPDVWREVYRTLRPGGYCLAFSGSRTQGLMAKSLEVAGFEILGQLSWVYTSGFPISKNPAILIDKEKGLMKNRGKNFRPSNNVAGAVKLQPTNDPKTLKEHEPISAEAKHWNGWGTVLKPSHEPIIIACKPFVDGSLPKNHLEWPPFLVHSKVSQKERHSGCENLFWALEIGSKGDWEQIDEQEWKRREVNNKISALWHLKKGNLHPTVKPVGVMRWLIDLLPERVNVICDPFMGSGSTGMAVKDAGEEFIGMEMDASSVVISQARINSR
jgi:site-specific DNA-methyltransferase (adenine-specific)